jgi:hypothetical protein
MSSSRVYRTEDNTEPGTPAKATIGRIVHFRDAHGKVYPAVVLSVHENGEAALEVFGIAEPRLRFPAKVSASHGSEKPLTWSWPPRV